MTILAVDEVMLREPRLLVPNMAPLGPVKPDPSHPLVSNANSILLLNKPGPWPPTDAKTHMSWVLDATYAGSFSFRPFAGQPGWGRDDTDEIGNGIYSPINLARAANQPLFILISFMVLVAPSAANKAAASIGSVLQDSSPEILLNSQNTTNLQLYFNGGYNYQSIPVSVGVWQRLAISFDGTRWSLLSSVRSAATVTAGTSGVSSTDRYWLGSGYNGQLPCAFNQFVAGNWDAPVGLLQSWLTDPWQIATTA